MVMIDLLILHYLAFCIVHVISQNFKNAYVQNWSFLDVVNVLYCLKAMKK